MSVLEERPAHISRSQACEVLGLNRSATYPRAPRRKFGPHKPQPRALKPTEKAGIVEVLGEDRYVDESIARIHARELSEGRVHASASTMYRVARAERMTVERRPQRPPRRHTKPSITVDGTNQTWTWDITKLPTFDVGLYLSLYVILDLFSRYPVGWMVSRKENASLAVQLFRETIRRQGVNPSVLIIHQDRGSPMIAHQYQDFVTSLGATLSHSRPRVSNDNAMSEAQFKTLKYAPSYPGRFEGCRDARRWVAGFMDDYVDAPHSSLAMFTPADVYLGRVDRVHRVRQQALDVYWREHPERFVLGPPIAQRPPATVSINPADGRSAEQVLADNDALEDGIDPVVVMSAHAA